MGEPRIVKKSPIGFPDEEGDYENPDVVISSGKATAPLPANVACVGSLVIYSSSIEKVANCAGYSGPGAAKNAVVTKASDSANAEAAKIPCAKDCKEIWRGWQCDKDLFATGAVEVKIGCDVASPN